MCAETTGVLDHVLLNYCFVKFLDPKLQDGWWLFSGLQGSLVLCEIPQFSVSLSCLAVAGFLLVLVVDLFSSCFLSWVQS